MERIIYRLTLDTHKTGVQKTLQGFQTADNMARRIAISLVSGSNSLEFDEVNTVALMYVTTPNATEPSINDCTIEDNTIYYDVLPIVEEGITEMQIKLIETSTGGAKSVLASPKFNVEVSESGLDDSNAEQTTTFTALEDAIAKANGVYHSRLTNVEITKDCVFKAYYADGTEYESDAIKEVVEESIGRSEHNAKASETNAKTSEQNAKTSETNAKASETNAKESEDLAKKYMENAFSGTPEGYVQLVEDVDCLDIKTATETTLENSKNGGLRLIELHGNTENNELPTPDHPQSIINTCDCVEMINGYYDANSGYHYTATGYWCSKNKIPCNGVIDFNFETKVTLLCVFFKENAYLSYYRIGDIFNTSVSVPDGATHFVFSVYTVGTEPLTLLTLGKVTLKINGKYVMNIIVKDDNGNKKETTIYLNEPLSKYDALIRKDGKFKIERNTYKVKLTSGIVDGYLATESYGNLVSCILPYAPYISDDEENVMMTHFVGVSHKDRNADASFARCYIATDSGKLILRDSEDNNLITSLQSVQKFANENDVWIQYKVATPSYETLDTDAQIALNSLETFDEVTYVEVDSRVPEGEIKVEYGTSNVGALALKNANLHDAKEVESAVAEAPRDVAVPLMLDGWVLDGDVYKQTVDVEGLVPTAEPIVLLSSVDADATDAELNAYACLLDRTIVEYGSVTFFASAKPSISFTVILKGAIASEGQAIADVTNLVAEVNKLNSNYESLSTHTKTYLLEHGKSWLTLT